MKFDELRVPPNEEPMNEMYAVLSRDKNGNCGIVSQILSGTAMPLVFGHKRMLDIVKKFLPEIAAQYPNGDLIIVKYSQREILEVIKK